MHDKKRIGAIAGLVIIIILFLCTSFLSQFYGNEILNFAGVEKSFSKGLYVLVTIVAIVVAPFSTVPLIPIASNLWGWPAAGVLSIAGWALGAQLAFILARRFGKPFVEKVFSLQKLHAFENYFTNKNLFWTVVFLRMIIPVDILSYALGLFSGIKSAPFFLATLIGITPFAFIFAYAGNQSVQHQIIILMEVLAFFGLVYVVRKVIQVKKGD